MDHAEWRAAYRRATMDESTRRDYIEDLKIERALLLAEIDQLRDALRQLELDRDEWQRLASQWWRQLANQ